MKKIQIKRYFQILLGILLLTCAFNLFLKPNNFAIGGVSGLSLIAKKALGITPSLFVLIGNIILLIICFIFLSRKTFKNTVMGALLYPMFLQLTSKLPELIDLTKVDPIILAILAGIILGYGGGLVYKSEFSTGGMTVIEQIMTKYFKVTAGTSILIVNGTVVVIGGLIFGIEAMVYSIIILTIYSTFNDRIMLGISSTKNFYIITDKVSEIKKEIVENLNYDFTLVKGTGGYKNSKTNILICVIKNKDYEILKNKILSIDKNAFITITDSYETLNDNKKLRLAK